MAEQAELILQFIREADKKIADLTVRLAALEKKCEIVDVVNQLLGDKGSRDKLEKMLTDKGFKLW